MKKLIPNLIIFIIVLTSFVSTSQAAERYSDVSESDWFYDSVMELSQKGIINGFPDGTFRPSEFISAGQFIKMAVTALGEDPGNGTNYWADTYIKYANDIGLLENCIVKNYKKPLPRGEIVCIIAKALDIQNEIIKTEAFEMYDLYGYTPDKYVPDVLKVYNAGIMIGYPNKTFRYDKYINRAEACAVIHKLVTPITRRERQITSLTPVPVCYSNKEEVTNRINEYEGNNGCFFDSSKITSNGAILSEKYNPDITDNILETMKLMYDYISYPVFSFEELPAYNMVRLDNYSDRKFSHDCRYAMYTVKFYDSPTMYPETQWGYDTMFMKLEINRLSSDGLLNRETGKPDTYYEYKIKSLMRILFGTETGDAFSEFILKKYLRYSEFGAGDVPEDTQWLIMGNTKMVFFSDGLSRQLCFTFTKE